ncbi:MAG: hypothetical protein HFI17_08555 [Lachnospiraceae bacterium]|jgi:hypothetical protein|nr:hypothetical protein [Lachnospiraceae bacterium]
MADAVVTLKARKKMVQARAGVITLPPIVGMVFGTGGVDASGVPVVPSGNDESLKQEIFRKEVDSYTFTDDMTCRYLCTLAVNECANEDISEIGLYDSDGDLIAVKTFKAKGKDADLEMTFQIDDIF